MGNFFTKHFKGDPIIWVIFIFLMGVSSVEMFSASSGLAYQHNYHGHFFSPIIRHLSFLLAGFVLAFAVHLTPPKKIFAVGGIFYGVSILLLIYALLFGVAENEAARWVRVPILGKFQPSELAKISVVLWLSTLLGFFQKKGDVNKGFKIYLGTILLPAVLILVENLSTFLLLGIVCFFLLFIAGISVKRLGKVIAVVFGILVFLLVTTFVESWIAPERSALKCEGTPAKEERTFVYPITHRVGTWIGRIERHFSSSQSEEEKLKEKFDVTSAKKVQPGHAHIAVANGKWFGKGPGNSEERDFIPQCFSDFIFAVIVEEWGILSLVIIFAYLVLLERTCVIMNKIDNPRNAYAAVGLSCMIVVQAFMHIAVTLGLMPVTGQTLPLISRGGTSVLITCLYFGVILSLSRRLDEQESSKKRERKSVKSAGESSEGSVMKRVEVSDNAVEASA
ncbi:MAG: FtsW/RodA/SpoVE family cell cycle protein [Paludibacteraceae bacterium]|nr:FtsW/RodA/SpoVE family cell cycle protein [Paludibacteraceae bacterium]